MTEAPGSAEAADDTPGAAVRDFLWSHPEWWLVTLCALSGSFVLWHGASHWGHARHHMGGLPAELGAWVAMVGAMMLPLSVDAARVVAFRSLRARRHRAIAAYLAGVVSPWLALGVVAAVLGGTSVARASGAVVALLVVKVVWTLTPASERALARCHRLPSPASGLTGSRADRDCARAGFAAGGWCVVSCWPLMLACACAGHSLPFMMAAAAITAVERLTFRPHPRLAALGTALLACAYTLAG